MAGVAMSKAADGPRFEVRDAPPVRVARRDPQRALDFLRGPELAGDGTAPSAALIGFRSAHQRRQAGATTLAERVEACFWYHTIELPGGIVTCGAHDHRPLLPHYGLAESYRGQRVLDVATFDGFWAFEFERRGATVVALDLPTVADLDLPPAARAVVVAEGLGGPTDPGFAIAAEALDSQVTRVEGNVYTLDPHRLGTFDTVHVADLLLHLERPLEALRRLRAVTGGELVLADCYQPELSGSAGLLTEYRGGWSGLQWWLPSLDTLVQMVIDAGFGEVAVDKVYRLPTRFGDEGFWRARIRARP